ncbi:MAG TPA: hypothetical protein HA362_04755 [Nanoarchaeota archaeon]|nr:hypothetical protein [Nanoarchaeota archaeon]
MADTDLAVYKGQAIEQAGSLVAIIGSDEMQKHLAAFSVSDADIAAYKEGVSTSGEDDKAEYRKNTGLARRCAKQFLRIAGKKPYEPSRRTLCLELSVQAAEAMQGGVKRYMQFPQLIADINSRYAKLSADRAALEGKLVKLKDFLSGGAVRTLTLADMLKNYTNLPDTEQAKAAAGAAERCGYELDVSDASVREFYAQRLISECLAEEERVRVDFSITMGNYRSVQRQLKSIQDAGAKLMGRIIVGLENLRVIQEIYERHKMDAGLALADIGVSDLEQARSEIEMREKKLQEVQDNADAVKQASDIAECRVAEDKLHLSTADMIGEIDEVLGSKPHHDVVVIDAETGQEEVVTVGGRR